MGERKPACGRHAGKVPLLIGCGLALLLVGPPGGGEGADTRRNLAPVPRAGPLAGQRIYGASHALLIGINEYAHLPRERWLNFAANDVRSLRRVLTQHYGFSPANVTVLLNREATRARIQRELARLADRRAVSLDDCVLIYFSGHGQTVKLASGGEMGFLVPHDAEVDLADTSNAGPFLATCLPMKQVWDYLESSPAKHVLLLADACYSGLMARPRTLAALDPGALATLAGRRAVQVMTAGRQGEVSLEMSRYGHGAFTYKLLEELKARAAAPGGVFTATDLYASVKRAVSQATRGKQTPQMGNYDTEGDFLFVTTDALFPAPHAPWPATGGAPPIAIEPLPPAPQALTLPEAPPVVPEERPDIPPIVPEERPDIPPLPEPEPEVLLQVGQTRTDPRDGAELVAVPRGEFAMGSDGAPDAAPEHRVHVAAFWICAHEVTNEQYARFLNDAGHTRSAAGRLGIPPDLQQVNGRWAPRPGVARHPARGATWYGARAYVEWAGGRLPTEAEWEKAARGTDGRAFPWGSAPPEGKCVHRGGRGPAGRPARVGTFMDDRSPYGCLDMAGNALEWTSSLHRPYPYLAADGREDPNADGPRVVRGGALRDPAFAATWWRTALDPVERDNLVGFRCVVPAR